jgi:23S rRNA-intervening sequence protein
MREESLIPRHGGYRKLKSFQLAQLLYDVTVRFCDRYVDRRSRTGDQMVQAARSGVQNIAEGSQASGTSKKTELKLTKRRASQPGGAASRFRGLLAATRALAARSPGPQEL